MDEFEAEVHKRSARNLAKLRKLKADVQQIAVAMNRAVAHLHETNRVLQSLPLYRWQQHQNPTVLAAPAPAITQPALRLVVNNA